MLNRPTALAIATAAALAVLPPVMMLAATLTWGLGSFDMAPEDRGPTAMNTLVLATALITVLGWPAYFILDHFKRATWRVLSFVGFTLAAAPAACVMWMLTSFNGSNASAMYWGRQVVLIADRRLTLYGWLQLAETTAVVGLHGLAAALAFHYVWRKLSIEADVQA